VSSREDDEADGVPTPNTSSSFAFFAEAATLLADRLDAVDALKLRHWSSVDPHGAKRAAKISAELREMAARFASWPTCNDPELIALERPVLVPRLTHLTREVAEIVESLGPEARARLPR
jgi:hypothetical protein